MAVSKIDSIIDFKREYPRVRDWLIEALSYNDKGFTEVELLDGLVDRNYQLWTSANAVCVTSIIPNWNDKRVCCLFLVGGTKGKALTVIMGEGMASVEAYARSFGCEGLLGIGRPQWGKYLKRAGFDIDGSIFYKGF